VRDFTPLRVKLLADSSLWSLKPRMLRQLIEQSRMAFDWKRNRYSLYSFSWRERREGGESNLLGELQPYGYVREVERQIDTAAPAMAWAWAWAARLRGTTKKRSKQPLAGEPRVIQTAQLPSDDGVDLAKRPSWKRKRKKKPSLSVPNFRSTRPNSVIQ
jgi:hypothetical protein